MMCISECIFVCVSAIVAFLWAMYCQTGKMFTGGTEGGVEVKHAQTVWLDAIGDKSKTYEGRLNRGFWSKVQVGDEVDLTDGARLIRVKIVEITKFDTFGEAWSKLKDKLLPHDGTEAKAKVTSAERADKVYEDIFHMSPEKVKEIGVLAIKIAVVSDKMSTAPARALEDK